MLFAKRDTRGLEVRNSASAVIEHYNKKKGEKCMKGKGEKSTAPKEGLNDKNPEQEIFQMKRRDRTSTKKRAWWRRGKGTLGRDTHEGKTLELHPEK